MKIQKGGKVLERTKIIEKGYFEKLNAGISESDLKIFYSVLKKLKKNAENVG